MAKTVRKHELLNVYVDDENNYTVFPILNDKYWKHYKLQVSSFWTVEEIDFSKDKNHWENILTANERMYIKNILAFFAASDGIVAKNLECNFAAEIDVKEISYNYRFQGQMEDIHGETYSLMIETFITDQEEKMATLHALEHIPAIKKKMNWVQKWMNRNTATYAERVLAFVIVEGLFFSGSFAAIYWLKKRNLMPGLTFSNELISRDEGLHTRFGFMIYEDLHMKLQYDRVKEIMMEAVEIEKEFNTVSFPCNLIGLNEKLMSQYIEYMCDYLLINLKYEKIFNVKNPLEFMEHISIMGKTNFFEHRVSAYSKPVNSTTDEDSHFFTTDATF